MAYMEDPHLEFLSKCTNQELDGLVNCLVFDKDGKKRYTEELSSNKKYIRHQPEHSMYWQEIAAEVQCFGANSLMTVFRGGKGVKYQEILFDVCSHMKVKLSNDEKKYLPIAKIEEKLILNVIEKALSKLSPEELEKVAEEADIKISAMKSMTPQILLSTFITIFNSGGFKSYQLTLILANTILKAMIGRGLSFGGNIILTRSMSVLTGPIGWAISAIWLLIDVSGAAYRVTIPAVVQIAALRSRFTNNITPSLPHFKDGGIGL